MYTAVYLFAFVRLLTCTCTHRVEQLDYETFISVYVHYRCLALTHSLAHFCFSHNSTQQAIKWFYFKREQWREGEKSTPLCGSDTIAVGIETVLFQDKYATFISSISQNENWCTHILQISPCYKPFYYCIFFFLLYHCYGLISMNTTDRLYKSNRRLNFEFETYLHNLKCNIHSTHKHFFYIHIACTNTNLLTPSIPNRFFVLTSPTQSTEACLINPIRIICYEITTHQIAQQIYFTFQLPQNPCNAFFLFIFNFNHLL